MKTLLINYALFMAIAYLLSQVGKIAFYKYLGEDMKLKWLIFTYIILFSITAISWYCLIFNI